MSEKKREKCPDCDGKPSRLEPVMFGGRVRVVLIECPRCHGKKDTTND